MYRNPSFALFSFLFAFVIQAATPDIPKLIVQLGDDYYLVRDHAQSELERIGLPAFDAVEAASRRQDDPEVSLRAAAILRKLKAEKLWVGTFPKVATDSDLTLAAAIAQIAETTGNQVGIQSIDSESQRLVSVPPGLSYWQTIDHLSRNQEMQLRRDQGYQANSRLLLTSGPARGPAAFAGSFYAKLTTANRTFSSDLDLEKGTVISQDRLNYQISIDCEDHARVLRLGRLPAKVSAVRENGEVVTTQNATEWMENNYGYAMNASVPLPAQLQGVLKTLTVHWEILAVGDFQQLDLPLTEDEKTLGQGVFRGEVSLRQTEPGTWTGNSYSVRLVVEPNGYLEPALRLAQMSVQLIDAEGKAVSVPAWVTNEEISLSVNHTENVRPSLKARLSYPGIFSRRIVPFEFQNVRLPQAPTVR